MASIRMAAPLRHSSRYFHDNSSLCARFGELPTLVLAILLPLLLISVGLFNHHTMLLNCLVAFQAGLCGWISAALAGYGGAMVLREVDRYPLPRRSVLQIVQLLAYGLGTLIGWQAA